MTGVLARLVARAHGAEAPRLRPRLPARFETASAPQPPPEERDGVSVWQSLERSDRRPLPASDTARAPGPPPAETRSTHRRIVPDAVEPSALIGPPPLHPDRRDPADIPEARVVGAAPYPAISPPAAAAAPTGLPPTVPRRAPTERPPTAQRRAPTEPPPTGQRRAPTAPAPTTPPPAAVEPRNIQPHPRPPPEPLMPIAPVTAPPPAGPMIAAPPTSPSGDAGGCVTSAVPEPPDIVIHIGRIDLTAMPEPEPKPRRRPERPPMTRLTDYLRRDGDTR